jgi:hypothetical protein
LLLFIEHGVAARSDFFPRLTCSLAFAVPRDQLLSPSLPLLLGSVSYLRMFVAGFDIPKIRRWYTGY